MESEFPRRKQTSGEAERDPSLGQILYASILWRLAKNIGPFLSVEIRQKLLFLGAYPGELFHFALSKLKFQFSLYSYDA